MKKKTKNSLSLHLSPTLLRCSQRDCNPRLMVHEPGLAVTPPPPSFLHTHTHLATKRLPNLNRPSTNPTHRDNWLWLFGKWRLHGSSRSCSDNVLCVWSSLATPSLWSIKSKQTNNHRHLIPDKKHIE